MFNIFCNFEIKMINNNNITLTIIKDLSKELFPNCRVILFGSRARLDNTGDSDYDFMIITKENIDIQQKRFYKSILRKKLATHKIPSDILIQSESELIIKKQITGHIVKEIIKEGVFL